MPVFDNPDYLAVIKDCPRIFPYPIQGQMIKKLGELARTVKEVFVGMEVYLKLLLRCVKNGEKSTLRDYRNLPRL